MDKWKPGKCNCGYVDMGSNERVLRENIDKMTGKGHLTVIWTCNRADVEVIFHHPDCPACPPVVCRYGSALKGCHLEYAHYCCVVCGDGGRVQDVIARQKTLEPVCLECIPSSLGKEWRKCPNLIYTSI